MSNLTPIERISKAVEWYNGLPQDYNNVDRLINAANRFACAVFEFSREVGDLYQEKNATEYRRKAAFVKYRAEFLQQQEKVSYSAAAEAAEAKILDERKDEQMADAVYYQAKLMLDSAKDVLDRLNQHISNLKQEKRLEMAGQGSQR